MPSTFRPQPHDPRWQNARKNPPLASDYPLWIDAVSYAEDNNIASEHHIDLYESPADHSTGTWAEKTLWLSDKTARTPIPIDQHEPTDYFWAWRFDDKKWLDGHAPVSGSFSGYYSFTRRLYTHWLPREKLDRTNAPRVPRFPAGDPGEGYRFLGEGETVAEGDEYKYNRERWCLCEGLVGKRVGCFGDVEDFELTPYRRKVSPANSKPVEDSRDLVDDALGCLGEARVLKINTCKLTHRQLQTFEHLLEKCEVPFDGIYVPHAPSDRHRLQSVNGTWEWVEYPEVPEPTPSISTSYPPPAAALTRAGLEEALDPVFERCTTLENSLSNLAADVRSYIRSQPVQSGGPYGPETFHPAPSAGWKPPVAQDRLTLAAAALQGLLADPSDSFDDCEPGETCTEAVARLAVEHADETLRALRKSSNNFNPSN